MIKTFSSRAGRLSETNKFYLHKKSKCIFSEKKLIIHEQKVLDVGFGDSDSFCKDIIENDDFLFFGAEPYKKGFSRAVEFYEKNNVENMILFNGDVRDLLEKVKFCFDFILIQPYRICIARVLKTIFYRFEFLRIFFITIITKNYFRFNYKKIIELDSISRIILSY